MKIIAIAPNAEILFTLTLHRLPIQDMWTKLVLKALRMCED